MPRLSAFCTIIAATALGFTACNSSGDDYEYSLPSSALVKSFSLSEDSNVLENLDNVFFSIDLANLSIFNADSMPYGTDVHALVPVITTGGASALELIVPRPGLSDTTYNYLTNSTDSIDFSNGPVTLRIKSYDETTTLDYTISVNVHKVKADSLTWSNVAYTKLPTTLSKVVAQQSVKFNGKAYCMTSDGTNFCMSTSANPGTMDWESKTLNLAFSPRVETLRSSSDALYVLDTQGKLYKSSDGGSAWSATGMTFDYLIGGYEDDMIGTVYKNGWHIVSVGGYDEVAPAEFPVYGWSMPVEYTFPMSASHEMTIVGGYKADGSLSGASWGFDGTNWICLSADELPEGLEGMTVFPYFIFEENSYFVATEYSIFVAFGGRDINGVLNSTTYISYNYGMSWQTASDLMQLPAQIPAMAYAQALVFPTDMTVSARSVAGNWTPIPDRPLPASCRIISGMPYADLSSRASIAITSWECPFIYLFGGEDAQERTYDTIWRGVINRFTFKPLQ